MLGKIKLKLVLINVGSLFVVLALFIAVIYAVMSRIMTIQDEALMKRVAAEEEIRIREDRVQEENGVLAFSAEHNGLSANSLFYVIKDKDNNTYKMSPNIAEDASVAEALVSLVLKSEDETGDVDIGDLRLSYAAVYKLDCSIFVFTDRSVREGVLHMFLIIASLSASAALGCVFAVSMFIAGRAIIPVRESIERQDKFISDASHELRTPLAVMRANLELVMDSPEETVGSQTKWLTHIHDQIMRVSSMSESLLTLAAVETRGVQNAPPAIDLGEVCSAAAEAFAPRAEQKGLELKCEAESGLIVRAESGDISQLCMIFLDNAYKYTEKGAISFTLKRDENAAVMTFADTGLGIDPQALPKIFGRFYRADKARSRETGGAGLGLAIAEAIIRRYKGTVSVESEPGKGSYFTVTLPLANRR